MTFMPIVLSVIYLKVGSLNCFLTHIFIRVDLHWIALFYSEESPQDAGSRFELRTYILRPLSYATPQASSSNYSGCPLSHYAHL